ncbi:MAG: hypothetical protein ACE5KO_06595 [Candidatus Bathyarchaeia archaeon]
MVIQDSRARIALAVITAAVVILGVTASMNSLIPAERTETRTAQVASPDEQESALNTALPGSDSSAEIFPYTLPDALDEKQWKQVLQWNGKGVANTQIFQIQGDQWRIRWYAPPEGGNIDVDVYDEFRKRVHLVANHDGVSAESYIVGKGRYYIYVNAGGGEWTVTVEDELPINVEPIKSVLSTNFVTVKRWSGSTARETENFTMNSDYWRIGWMLQSANFGVFQVLVYDKNNQPVLLVGNKWGENVAPGPFFSYVYTPPGEYHLAINSDVEYELVVEAPN